LGHGKLVEQFSKYLPNTLRQAKGDPNDLCKRSSKLMVEDDAKCNTKEIPKEQPNRSVGDYQSEFVL
jgi:hypothetical protein